MISLQSSSAVNFAGSREGFIQSYLMASGKSGPNIILLCQSKLPILAL